LAVFVNPPPVPVRVIVWFPVGVDAAAEIVKAAVNVGFPEATSKTADAPDGRSEADKVTTCGVPLSRVTFTVVWTLPPCCVDPLSGLTEIVKSKAPGRGSGVESVITM